MKIPKRDPSVRISPKSYEKARAKAYKRKITIKQYLDELVDKDR